LYQQQYPEAVKQFKLALKQQKQHPNSMAGLALAYVQLHQAEKALPLFEQLTVLEPKNPNAWFNLGSTAQCLNQPQKAESAYRQAIVLAPQYQAALFNLATLLENTVNYKDALGFYTDCATIDAGSLIGLEALKRSSALKLQLNATMPSVQ
jgi:tetratricopeptide (TPR) repeat protein